MDTFGIPAAFVLVAALALWVVIGSKGWWLLKIGVVTISVFFSVVLWNSLSTLQGWPTKETLPPKFEIKWIDVEEPNKKTGDKGRIHIWIKNMTKEYDPQHGMVLHNKGKGQDPRFHELPYSREGHEQASGIKKKIADGQKVYAEMGKNKAGEKGEGKDKGKGKSGKKGKGEQNGNGGSLSQEQEPMFHELPPPYFIPKEG